MHLATRSGALSLADVYTVLDQSPSAILVVSSEGQILFGSQVAKELIKCDPQSTYSHFPECVEPLDLELAKYQFQQLIKGKLPKEEWIWECRASNNIHRFLRVKISNHLEDERIAGILCSLEDVTVQETSIREQQRMLVEANERFQLAAHAVNASIFEWNLTSGQILRTRSLEGLLGYTAEECEDTFHWWKDRIAPEDVQYIENKLQDVLDGEEPFFEAEYRMLHKNGSIVYVWDRGMMVRAKDGTPLRMIGSTQDITERKRIEEALSHSEREYRLLFDTNPFPMWVYDIDTFQFLAVNESAIKHYGYSREEFLSMSVVDIRPMLELENFYKSNQKREGSGHVASVLHQTKGGRIFETEIHYSTIDFHGKRSRLVLAHDISARNEAERQLRVERSSIGALINNTEDLMWSCNAQYELITFNESFAQYIRGAFNLEPLVGMRMDFLYPEDGNKIWNERFERVYKGERFIVVDDYDYLSMEYSFNPIIEDENITGVAIFGRNITERRRMEAQLITAKEKAEEMNELKSSFLANMSHEIRTPMTAIIGYANYLSESIESESLRSCSQAIERSGYRLLETINGILDLARIESNKVELRLAEIPVYSEIESVMESLLPLARQKNLPLYLHKPETDCIAYVDRHYFGRVLTNLIGNAVKFTDEGQIDIFITSDSLLNIARIEVRDSGVGISEEFIPRIFEDFTQESTGYSRSFEGSGLGLAISKRLAKLLGGDLTVESVLGEGSSFFLSVPLAKMREVTAIAHRDRSGGSGLSARPKILIVEDSDITADLLSLQLQDEFDTEVCLTATEAMKRTLNTPYDLIIMDVNLGADISGLDITRHLRTTQVHARTPIIALTAYAMIGDREEALAAGCSGYLSKPFKKEDLLEVVYEQLQHS